MKKNGMERVNIGSSKEYHDRAFLRRKENRNTYEDRPQSLWERFEERMVSEDEFGLYRDEYEYLAGHEEDCEEFTY